MLLYGAQCGQGVMPEDVPHGSALPFCHHDGNQLCLLW